MYLPTFYYLYQSITGGFYNEPAYDVLFEVRVDGGCYFEVRNYTETRVAAVTRDDGDAFQTLAAYIGVGGSPQNEGAVGMDMTTPVAVDMTTPVVTSVEIDMTTPVVTSVEMDMTTPVVTSVEMDMTTPVVTSEGDEDEEEAYMQFILPKEYDSIESTPKPLSDDVRLVEIPPRAAAVKLYNWWATTERNEEVSGFLLTALEENLVDNPLNQTENIVELLQYNGPGLAWVVGYLMRNEMLIELTDEQVEELSAVGV